jgi:competence protein ComGC
VSRLSAIAEFWDFLKHRKKFWLLPLVLVLVVLGVVIVLTANSALAPFIYTIF